MDKKAKKKKQSYVFMGEFDPLPKVKEKSLYLTATCRSIPTHHLKTECICIITFRTYINIVFFYKILVKYDLIEVSVFVLELVNMTVVNTVKR